MNVALIIIVFFVVVISAFGMFEGDRKAFWIALAISQFAIIIASECDAMWIQALLTVVSVISLIVAICKGVSCIKMLIRRYEK